MSFTGNTMAKKPLTLTQTLDAQIRRSIDRALHPGHHHKHNKRPKVLAWSGTSDCFDDLRYSKKDGGVYMTFTDGYQDFEPMDKATARDWFSDDVGRWYNTNIRWPKSNS